MTRPPTSPPPAKPNPLAALALKGKLGLILVGAIALIGLRPMAERLWDQVSAPAVERRLGGPGFPADQAQLALRMDEARGAPVGSVWHEMRQGERTCRRLKAVSLWIVCDRGDRPAAITATIAGPRVDPVREMGVLVETAARGASAAQRQAALDLLKGRRGGAVTIGEVRITALPGRIDGWVLDARPVG